MMDTKNRLVSLILYSLPPCSLLLADDWKSEIEKESLPAVWVFVRSRIKHGLCLWRSSFSDPCFVIIHLLALCSILFFYYFLLFKCVSLRFSENLITLIAKWERLISEMTVGDSL